MLVLIATILVIAHICAFAIGILIAIKFDPANRLLK